MVKLELFDYVFCGICYELMLPEARKPVFCTLCKSAVYCQPCIEQAVRRVIECPYCRQRKLDGPIQFAQIRGAPTFKGLTALKKLLIQCKNYPYCQEILPMDEIESHELLTCRHMECK